MREGWLLQGTRTRGSETNGWEGSFGWSWEGEEGVVKPSTKLQREKAEEKQIVQRKVGGKRGKNEGKP